MMEELCREKDSTISDLKQDIQSLESKVLFCPRVFSSPEFIVVGASHLS